MEITDRRSSQILYLPYPHGKARELLESGKCPVNVVPEMIGLRNLKNFRNRYKEYFKITPCKSIKRNRVTTLLTKEIRKRVDI